jgi:hypothetical protein
VKKKSQNSRKAETNSLNTIIGIIIATACVMIIFYVGDNVYGALTGRNSGISNNFGMFAEKINSITAGQKATATFYLTRGYSAVGFNKEDITTKYDCGFVRYGAVKKPNVAACKDSACICICRKNGDCEHPYECRNLAGVDNVLFILPYNFAAGLQLAEYPSYNYFYIQTSCVIRPVMTASVAFSVEKKTEDSGHINLYIKVADK